MIHTAAIKTVIFDMDGTLIKLPIDYVKINRELKNLFSTDDDFKPLIPTIIKKSGSNSKLIKDAFEIICNEEKLSTNNFQVFDGTLEILKYLQKNNFKIFLVTMQCRNAADIVLERLSIKKYFSEIITRDDIPDRYLQINKIIEKNSLEPNEILLVGDRINDINSAKKARCHGILYSKEQKIDFNASQKITNLLELKSILS